jgi:hypothetical protein
MDDGRVFYYTKNATSAILAAGQLYTRATAEALHAECDVTLGALGGFTVTGITIGAAAITANRYADGYMIVTDGVGEGQTYRVKDHLAASSSATTFAVNLYDNIALGLSTTATVTFVTNDYDSPIISPTALLTRPIGVPVFAIPAGDVTNQYGWLQTFGPCALLQGEAIADLAQALVPDTGVAGSVEECDNVTTVSQEFIVGWNISAAVDTEYTATFLTIRQ